MGAGAAAGGGELEGGAVRESGLALGGAVRESGDLCAGAGAGAGVAGDPGAPGNFPSLPGRTVSSGSSGSGVELAMRNKTPTKRIASWAELFFLGPHAHYSPSKARKV